MSKAIIIDRDTPIIIFGAGFTGYHYYEILEANDMAVSCFIDWNADKLNPKNEIRILKPDDPAVIKAGAVVIIGLSNVFEHKAIVEQLSDLGYSLFIFYDSEDRDRKVLYERFTQGESILNKEIVQYQADEVAWEKELVVDGNEVVVSVPFEIVNLAPDLQFSYLDEERDYFKARKGKSIFSVNALINLYEIFERGFGDQRDFEVLEESREYKRNMEAGNYQEDIFEIQLNAWWRSRYTVWQMMIKELMRGFSFFWEVAPLITRNKLGVFEERDGNNRAAFFMAKRIYRMPYRMSRIDYEAWINRSVLKKVSEYVKERHIIKLPYPIPHPYFYSFEIQRELYAPKRLRTIYNYLVQKKWDSAGKTILDINGKVSYYASFLGNMGAKCIAVEDEKIYAELILLLNELFGWNVGVISSEEYIEKTEPCDLVVISIDDKISIANNFIDSVIDHTSTGIILEVKHGDVCAIMSDQTLQEKFEITKILEEMVADTILATLVLWKR